jgi:hypothetical protein
MDATGAQIGSSGHMVLSVAELCTKEIGFILLELIEN